VSGVSYFGFLDFAGGSIGGDSACLAIAHVERRDGRMVLVLDLVVEIRPPFSPEQACKELAATLRTYGLGYAVSDKWGGQFPVEAMAKLGIRVVPSAKPKSILYLELLPHINAGSVEWLDHDRMLAQLVALERRVARSGQTSVDHPVGGAHDDLINAAAGALTCAALAKTVREFDPFTGRLLDDDGEDEYDLTHYVSI
jgi:hypothetical protein